LVNQISIGLLLYSHLPTATFALLFGGFLIYRNKSIQSISLFIICLAFVVWCLLDLGSWFAFLGARTMMFTWSITDLFTLIIFSFSYYFLYSFIENRDLPLWQKVTGFALILPTLFWTFFGRNLLAFDGVTCQAIENDFVTNYPLYLQVFFLILSVGFSIYKYLKTKEKALKKKIALAGTGISIFLMFFFFSLFLADLLINKNIWQNAYNVEIYGLFGMPILLMFLGYLIIRYKAFDIKVFSAQALVVALIVLIASEFVFVTSFVNQILVGVTLFFACIGGYLIVKSVKRQIEAKEKIEKLAIELDAKNVRLLELDKQKTEFISFATHQLRSPLTAMKGNVSLALEGDYGPVSAPVKEVMQTIFTSIKTMINIVEDYLNVSRIELGTMKYTLNDMDFKDLVQEVANEQKPNIEAKNLKWSVTFDATQTYKIKADPDKFKQVLMNTVDNSIKYTPEGSIALSLEKMVAKDGPNAGKSVVRFKVADTGVGIRADVIPKLFQKFSRAPKASEANIHGTGLGLFIAKEIMIAHGGRVWAESAGEGKGSQFYVEVPEVK
jgi:signal transduction histidine kinase